LEVLIGPAVEPDDEELEEVTRERETVSVRVAVDVISVVEFPDDGETGLVVPEMLWGVGVVPEPETEDEVSVKVSVSVSVDVDSMVV
jgi:hypothetical protein